MALRWDQVDLKAGPDRSHGWITATLDVVDPRGPASAPEGTQRRYPGSLNLFVTERVAAEAGDGAQD